MDDRIDCAEVVSHGFGLDVARQWLCDGGFRKQLWSAKGSEPQVQLAVDSSERNARLRQRERQLGRRQGGKERRKSN